MGRRVNKYQRPPRPLLSGGNVKKETKGAGIFYVRQIAGARSSKNYTCPGCQHNIAIGTAHLVVWPLEPSSGLSNAIDERRHWHSSCWQANR